jgi:hypothetical protein
MGTREELAMQQGVPASMRSAVERSGSVQRIWRKMCPDGNWIGFIFFTALLEMAIHFY